MKFIELFQYSFFTNAFIASIIAGITCGIIGTYIVTRRMVFIAGGITHTSFGGIGVAYYFGWNPIGGAVIFAVLSALGIDFISRKADVRNDSAIAILWAAGMSLGIIMLYLTPGYAPNLMSYLFGNILTVTSADLVLMSITCVFVIFFFLAFYRTIVTISFDEGFCRTRKIPVQFFNYLLMSLTAIVIVINIKVAGIILVLSLFTIPQNIANIFSGKFSTIIILSIIFSFIGSIGGLISSYYLDLPSGPAIIGTLIILFVIAKSWELLRQRMRLKRELDLR